MPSKREIIYPYFLECSECAKEPFWNDIFKDLAYGVVPTGTYISKGFLCCNYKNREFTYQVENPSKSVKTIYDELYTLFTQKLLILSKKQAQQKKYDFFETEEAIKNSIQSWNGIRKKAIKDALYRKFVLEKKEEYNLSFEASRKLLSFISLAMVFRTITSKDIVYEGGKITEIYGISFEPEKVIYEVPFCAEEGYDTEEEPVKTEKTLRGIWEKFLQGLE